MLTYELRCDPNPGDPIFVESVMVYDVKETPTDFLASDVKLEIINIPRAVVAFERKSLANFRRNKIQFGHFQLQDVFTQRAPSALLPAFRLGS